MKTIKFIFVILLFLAITSLYFNFNLFQSYILQSDLIVEYNNKSFTNTTFEKFKATNIDFPNVTITTLPLQPLLANYFHLFGETDTALKMLDVNLKDNKFIYYKEALKSQIFYELKSIDSSSYYAKKAYLNIPQNPIHFERLSFPLAYQKKFDSIVYYFNYVDHEDIVIWKLFFATLLTDDSEASFKTKAFAEKAKIRFPLDPDINVFSNSLLYGKENVELSNELAKQGEIFYTQREFSKASEFFEKSLKLNPGSYSNYENAAACFLEINDFKSALLYSSIVLDRFNLKKGKSEYIKALALYGLNKNDEACKYLRLSFKRGFKNAYPYLEKYCK
jgi:tetratricopeptide (TPR) repeat protein